MTSNDSQPQSVSRGLSHCSYLQTVATEPENAMIVCAHWPQPGNRGVLQLPELSGISRMAA